MGLVRRRPRPERWIGAYPTREAGFGLIHKEVWRVRDAG